MKPASKPDRKVLVLLDDDAVRRLSEVLQDLKHHGLRVEGDPRQADMFKSNILEGFLPDDPAKLEEIRKVKGVEFARFEETVTLQPPGGSWPGR